MERLLESKGRRKKMNFPCKNCIVDAMCIDSCFEFRIYLHEFKILDSGYRITSIRLKRLSKLANVSGVYFRHYSVAYKKYMENKNGTSL